MENNLSDIIKQKAVAIDAIIDGFLPAEEGPAKTVMTAMNYSIHVGGKRLRPMLMLETFRMFNGADERIVHPFMAAIEMIHTYSLCHDDLPAMDNDDMRRGMKSTHAKFGEAMGILAGDALLNYAFETALKSYDHAADAVQMRRINRALRVLAEKAGIYGMIAGQVADIESENRPAGEVTMDMIRFIHKNKTAAMIESSMMTGAILAGASDSEIKTVEQIGSDIGLAFQIVDDILDVTGNDEILGKPTGSDDKNNKTTYVSLVGLDKAGADVRKVSQRAVDSLQSLPGADTESGRFLADLIGYLVVRDR
ncbi:MAG: polyprenyl synthetase family protein [Lachnospiraceae bacterium]|nr:polyprenyl synthetase family protein [Lachnospiraceae bacterium]